MKSKLSILMLEDEQRAGEKLGKMIARKVPGAEVTWLRSVEEGLEYLKARHKPDLIFSDIELLDGNAFKIYEAFNPECPIIFCTAFDTFYVDAFKTNGIAYLLKPYNQEEFDAAWDKYQLLFSNDTSVDATQDLLHSLGLIMQNKEPASKDTFTVKKKDGVHLLKSTEIAYFQAQGDFVLAFDSSGSKHILNYRLNDLEQLVNPHQFFQINRSELVNFNYILKFENYIKNRVAIHLTKPSVTLYTSNSRTPAFREWLESH